MREEGIEFKMKRERRDRVGRGEKERKKREEGERR